MTMTETYDKGHGRIEVRRYRVSQAINWLKQRHPEWHKLTSIVAIDSERHSGESIAKETRYFISSKAATAEQLLAACAGV